MNAGDVLPDPAACARRVADAVPGAACDCVCVRAPAGGSAGGEDDGEGERELLAALRAASGEIVVVAWSGAREPLPPLRELVEPVARGQADLCAGRRRPSRRTSHGLRGWPAGLAAWALSEAGDPLSGILAVRRSALARVDAPIPPALLALAVELSAPGPLRVRDVDLGAAAGAPLPRAAARRILAEFAGARMPEGFAARAVLAIAALVGVDAGVFAALGAAGLAARNARVASFAAAAIVAYPLIARWVLRARSRPATVARYTLAASMAFALRGACLAASAAGAPAQQLFGVAAGATVAGAVLAAASVFWVFADTRSLPSARRWRLAAVGVVAWLVVLRAAWLPWPELLPDEAYHWTWSTHLDIGYLDHPPLTAWVIRATTWLFGRGELGVRAGAWLADCCTIGFLYAFGRDLYGRGVGLGTALLVACLPFYFATGLVVMPDSFLFACWSAGLYTAARAVLHDRRSAWWLFALCLGLGFLAKYNMGLLGLGLALFVLIDPRSRHWLRRPEPYGAAVLAFVVLSPVLVWNYQHDWASFVFQTERRFERSIRFTTPFLLLHAALLLTPAFLLAALRSLWPDADGTSDARVRRFVTTVVATALLPFVINSFTHAGRAHWTACAWLAVLPGVARLLPAGSRAVAGARGLQRTFAPTVAGLLLFYGLGLHYVVLGLPGIPYGSAFDRYFWRESIPEIQRTLARLRAETGREPALGTTSKWSIAAVLSFYGPPEWQDTVGSRHYFGKQASMWNQWNPVTPAIGRPLLLVGRNDADLQEKPVLATLEGVGPIHAVPLERDGVRLRKLHYRTAQRYLGPPPVAPELASR